MRRLLFITSFIATALSTQAQVYTYNFGSVVDSVTSGAVTSPTFLPTPSDGGSTARVRVGTGGGKFTADAYGNFGTGSSLRITAATNTSANKFSIYNIASASTTFGMKFQFSIGDSLNSPASSLSNGSFYFFAGNGASYSDNSTFTGSQVFSGVQLICGASGAAMTYRSGSNWINPVVPITVPYATTVNIAIYANNGNSSVNYTDVNNASRTLAADSWDLFADGVYIGNLNKAALTNGTNINSFMFYGVSSTGNLANVFIDDIVYTNNIVNNTLPIRLSMFDAVADNNTVRLFWKAEVESDVKQYVVEHSANGSDFKEIGTVNSLKTNGSSYTFNHQTTDTRNYYRLKTVNDNGHIEYSQVITVTVKSGVSDMKAWYSENSIHVSQHKNADVSVFDMNGKCVLSTMLSNSDYELDVAFLAPGNYIAYFRNDKETTLLKFVK